MGTIENKTYKNIFVTPTKDVLTLQVYMQDKYLCGDIFRIEAEKESVHDIAIFCSELEQKDFNTLINKIKSITDKPTYISFASENNYKKYIEDYKYQYRHFPDNISIRNVIVEFDQEKSNIIRPGNVKKKSL
jgi:hypothetical protein